MHFYFAYGLESFIIIFLITRTSNSRIEQDLRSIEDANVKLFFLTGNATCGFVVMVDSILTFFCYDMF